MKENVCSFEYALDNHFFETIDAPEVQKGKVAVSVQIKKTAGVYELGFHTEGTVQITCDRCLDDMDQPIQSDDTLRVKLGAGYSEESEIVVIPEDEGEINVAWFIYEFIVLSIPMKHVHAPGKCNKAMVGKLNRYMRASADEEADDWSGGTLPPDENPPAPGTDEIDPRWNELKKIIGNN